MLNSIVVDGTGLKVEYALYDEDAKELHAYTLKEGESLIFEGIGNALAMKKPRWDGTAWIETATQDFVEDDALPPKPDYMGFLRGLMEGFGDD